MISKSLIISTNLQKEINTMQDCMVINLMLTELAKTELLNFCDEYSEYVDSALITVHYRHIWKQMDLTEDYKNPLDSNLLACIVKPFKDHLRQMMLSKWSGVVEDLEQKAVLRSRVNFNVMFLSNGTIMLTEEVFES